MVKVFAGRSNKLSGAVLYQETSPPEMMCLSRPASWPLSELAAKLDTKPGQSRMVISARNFSKPGAFALKKKKKLIKSSKQAKHQTKKCAGSGCGDLCLGSCLLGVGGVPGPEHSRGRDE